MRGRGTSITRGRGAASGTGAAAGRRARSPTFGELPFVPHSQNPTNLELVGLFGRCG